MGRNLDYIKNDVIDFYCALDRLGTTPGGTVLRSFPIGDDLSPSASEATTAASPSPTPSPTRSGYHDAAAAAASTEPDHAAAAAAARQPPADGNAAGRTSGPTLGAGALGEGAEPDLDAVLASAQLPGARNAFVDGPTPDAESANAAPEAYGVHRDAAQDLDGGNAVGCVAPGGAIATVETAGVVTAEQWLAVAAAPTAAASAAASRQQEAAVAAAAARNSALLAWRHTSAAGAQGDIAEELQEGDMPRPDLSAAAGTSAVQHAVSPADDCAPENASIRSEGHQLQTAIPAAVWNAAQQGTGVSMSSAELAAAGAHLSHVEAAPVPQAASAKLEAAVAAASAQNEALLGRQSSDVAATQPIHPGQAAQTDPISEPLEGSSSGALLTAAESNSALVGGGRETDTLEEADTAEANWPVHPAATDPSTDPLEGASSHEASLAAAVAAAAASNNALIDNGGTIDALGAAVAAAAARNAAVLGLPEVASDPQNPRTEEGVEPATAAAARTQPSLVPPRERSSAAAQHSAQSERQVEHSGRSVPPSKPGLKSRFAQQRDMRPGALDAVQTGDALAAVGAVGQGASSAHEEVVLDEQATLSAEDRALDRQMIPGINPSLLPARFAQLLLHHFGACLFARKAV